MELKLKNSGDDWERDIIALYEQAEREGRLCPKCRGVLGGPVHAEACETPIAPAHCD